MKTILIPNTDLNASRISLGCMRISEKSVDETEELVRTALDEGINFFDHEVHLTQCLHAFIGVVNGIELPQ